MSSHESRRTSLPSQQSMPPPSKKRNFTHRSHTPTSEAIETDTKSSRDTSRVTLASSMSITSNRPKTSKIPSHSQSYYFNLAHRLMHEHDNIKKERMMQKKIQELHEEANWFQPNDERRESAPMRRASSTGRIRPLQGGIPAGAASTRRSQSTMRPRRQSTQDPNYTPVFERVHHDILSHTQKIRALHEKHDTNRVHCTFQPEISERSKEIVKRLRKENVTKENDITKGSNTAESAAAGTGAFHDFNFAARGTIKSSQHRKELLKEAREREALADKPQISKQSQEIIKNNPLYRKDVNFLDRQRFLAMESERIRLQNEENYAPSFQPSISKRSDLIAQYRRKRLSIDPEKEQNEGRPVYKGKDDLFGYYQSRESNATTHVDPRCTFQPQINEYSKSIAKTHTIEELIQFAKEREERIEKQQKLKESEALKHCTFKPKLVAKATEDWLRKSLSRDPTSPTIKERNQHIAMYDCVMHAKKDEAECTFQPKVNPYFKHDPEKSLAFTQPELRSYDARAAHHKKAPVVRGLESFFERIKRKNLLKQEEELRKRERLYDTSNKALEAGFVLNHDLDRVAEEEKFKIR